VNEGIPPDFIFQIQDKSRRLPTSMYRSRRLMAPKRTARSRSRSVAPRKMARVPRPVVKASYARSLVSARGVGAGPGLKTQLKTIIWNKFTLAATGVGTFSLKTGSCFDPTGGLSAIQPAEFDQIKALYNRYVVLGGSVKVTISQPNNPALNGAGAQPFVCAMYPDIDSTVKTTFQDAASQDWSVARQCSSGGNAVSMYQRFSHAALLGKKGPVSSEDNGALVTADPTAGQFILHNVFIQSLIAGSFDFTVLVEIIQDVYFDRKITVIDA